VSGSEDGGKNEGKTCEVLFWDTEVPSGFWSRDFAMSVTTEVAEAAWLQPSETATAIHTTPNDRRRIFITVCGSRNQEMSERALA
jgi:hypothetical protein